MVKLRLLIGLIISLNLWADASSQEILSPYNTSNRCRELLRKRAEKKKVLQQLDQLAQRSANLLKASYSKKRVSTIEKLERTAKRVERERLAAQMSLKNMEEDIIRKGCPGIAL